MVQYIIYLLSINNHIFFCDAIVHIYFTVALLFPSPLFCFLFVLLLYAKKNWRTNYKFKKKQNANCISMQTKNI